jgi:hypothetical protein
MARGRKSNEGRFGNQPVEGVIDAELTQPSLSNCRAHLGLCEAAVSEASELIEAADEKGREFLLSEPPGSDLTQLGEVKLKADAAVSKLSIALANAVRCRDIANALIENVATGKPADMTLRETADMEEGHHSKR